MALWKDVNTVKRQLTVDKTMDRILDELVGLGIHGTTKAEFGSWVIRTLNWGNPGSVAY